MKSKVTDKSKPSEKPFPKLMICSATGVIVLMISPEKGTVVGGSSALEIGDYFGDWNYFTFTDYNGAVELSNE